MSAEIKPAYGLDRVLLSKVVPLKMPFTLFLSVSTACNFTCKYCVHSLPKATLTKKNFIPQNMSWDTFLKAAHQTKDFPERLKALFLYGVGEPLCNKLLPDMIRYAKKIEAADQVAFITNGALLNKDISNKIIDSGIDTIRISLQGLSSEKYRDVCGTDVDVDHLIENIEYLYSIKNECEIYVKIADIALDHGDEEKFYGLFKNISDRMYVEKIVPVFHEIDYDKMLHGPIDTDLWGNTHDSRIVCPICFYTLNVLPNGVVYPCCMEEDPAGLGDIHHETLAEIWNGKAHRKFLTMQLEKKRMQNPVCKNCSAPDTFAKPEDELDSDAPEVLSRLYDK